MNESLPGGPRKIAVRLPSVDAVLKQAADLLAVHGHAAVTAKIRESLDAMRHAILLGAGVGEDREAIVAAVLQQVKTALAEDDLRSLVPVFNLTGTILHTNLGRALLPASAIRAVAAAVADPVNLEYDLQRGERGERDGHVESLICELTGAEAATVVNNNAAAVLLVLNSLALGREVPVSRGELVEIGGSFRIPDVMERAGCRLVETGTTNRTHPRDFEKAIHADTALLMKVHASNYRIEGFTAEVGEAALAELAHKHGLPFVMDMGSGSLVSLEKYGLPAEPTARDMLSAGADIVTFSGDKLLGGPQCGIIAGSRELLERIRRNPLKRALRPDKMTLAALAAVLKLYRDPDRLVRELPAMRHFTRPEADIRQQATRLLPGVQAALPGDYRVAVVATDSQIGSGALPVAGIPSAALQVTHAAGDAGIRRLNAALHRLPQPVIGRIHKGSLLMDMRCLDREKEFTAQLSQLAGLLA